MTDSLQERFARELRTLALQPGVALVAVSGGPDSLALLDLLATLDPRPPLDLRVVHVDHGIHPDSAAVARCVGRHAARYGLPFEVATLELGAGTSETVAREARYAALAEAADRHGAETIFTAHHADDQVETVLMRFLAGSGAIGLAGMAPRRGRIARPLLGFRRAELARHIEGRGLEPWIDPANSDPRHLRSWLRGEVLPALRERIPSLDARLLGGAAHAAADRLAWDRLLDVLPLDLRAESDVHGGRSVSVAAPVVGGYDSALGSALLRAVARRLDCPLGPRHADRVVTWLRRGESGGSMPLGGGWTAELSFGRLYLRRPTADSAEPFALDAPGGERRWGRWVIRWWAEPAPERQERHGSSAWFAPGPLEIRGWRAGDRVRPLGGVGHRLVKKCFQESRVPRSHRAGWPVVAQGTVVVWVPGVCRSDGRWPDTGTEAVRVDVTDA
jgi:tRNA(Ile)-lysidine synthase